MKNRNIRTEKTDKKVRVGKSREKHEEKSETNSIALLVIIGLISVVLVGLALMSFKSKNTPKQRFKASSSNEPKKVAMRHVVMSGESWDVLSVVNGKLLQL